MLKMTDGRMRWVLTVGLAAALCACGPSTKTTVTTTRTTTPQPPAVEPGDKFLLQGRLNESASGKVTVRMETDAPGPKGKRQRVARTFSMTEQHTTAAVDEKGNAQITGRLQDVEGKGDTAKEQREADGLARALSEMKVTFTRTPLGEVSDLVADPINKPLDPSTAQIVARSIYGAGRGVLFAQGRQQVGQTWKMLSEVPLPGGGGSNKLDVDYHYEKKEGTVATVTFTGKSTGMAGDTPLAGELKGTLLFDVVSGAFLSQMVDAKSVRAEGTPTSVTVALHVEWQAQTAEAAPTGGAAPAPAPAK